MKYDLAIFDLDGTLLDTSKGIFNSVRYAEKKMNLNPIPEECLKVFVGPPPKEMYQKVYGLSEDDAIKATGYHRQYAREHGVYEFAVYEGIISTIQGLRKGGLKIAVATLKSESIALDILKYAGIEQLFDVIIGMDVDESRTKAITIRLAMEQTASRSAIMIGDSKYDAIGAKQAGVDFIAVTYGFGFSSQEDIEENPYCSIVDAPAKILDVFC